MPWRRIAVSLIGLCLAPACWAATKSSPGPTPIRLKTEDGWTIAALYHPPRPGQNVAVLIHGFGSSKNEWSEFSAKLWELGMGTLAIDLRGHGESREGPSGKVDPALFAQTTDWTQALKDLEAALAYLKKNNIPSSRTGLIGASIGANLASQEALKNTDIPWIALLSPGWDYGGVLLSELKGRDLLVAAAPSDAYAYRTAAAVAFGGGQTAFLLAKSGHGVQMFKDDIFLGNFLQWLKARRGQAAAH